MLGNDENEGRRVKRDVFGFVKILVQMAFCRDSDNIPHFAVCPPVQGRKTFGARGCQFSPFKIFRQTAAGRDDVNE